MGSNVPYFFTHSEQISWHYDNIWRTYLNYCIWRENETIIFSLATGILPEALLLVFKLLHQFYSTFSYLESYPKASFLTPSIETLTQFHIRVTPIGSTFEFQPEPLGTFRYWYKTLKNTFCFVLAPTETRGKPFEVGISQ